MNKQKKTKQKILNTLTRVMVRELLNTLVFYIHDRAFRKDSFRINSWHKSWFAQMRVIAMYYYPSQPDLNVIKVNLFNHVPLSRMLLHLSSSRICLADLQKGFYSQFTSCLCFHDVWTSNDIIFPTRWLTEDESTEL